MAAKLNKHITNSLVTKAPTYSFSSKLVRHLFSLPIISFAVKVITLHSDIIFSINQPSNMLPQHVVVSSSQLVIYNLVVIYILNRPTTVLVLQLNNDKIFHEPVVILLIDNLHISVFYFRNVVLTVVCFLLFFCSSSCWKIINQKLSPF